MGSWELEANRKKKPKKKTIMVTVQQPVERISAPDSFKICRPADLNSEQPAGVSVWGVSAGHRGVFWR